MSCCRRGEGQYADAAAAAARCSVKRRDATPHNHAAHQHPQPPPAHLFFAHSGLKWIVRQILPPRYILAVLPSSSGSSISGATAGYVAGTSNWKSNSYLMKLWTYLFLNFEF